MLKSGWLAFITYIDWVWVASFIFTAWVVVRIIRKSNIFPKINFNVRKLWIVIIWGVIWAVFFALNDVFRHVYLSEEVAKIPYITVLVFSFFGAIAIHEIVPLSKYLDKIFGVKE